MTTRLSHAQRDRISVLHGFLADFLESVPASPEMAVFRCHLRRLMKDCADLIAETGRRSPVRDRDAEGLDAMATREPCRGYHSENCGCSVVSWPGDCGGDENGFGSRHDRGEC